MKDRGVATEAPEASRELEWADDLLGIPCLRRRLVVEVVGADFAKLKNNSPISASNLDRTDLESKITSKDLRRIMVGQGRY